MDPWPHRRRHRRGYRRRDYQTHYQSGGVSCSFTSGDTQEWLMSTATVIDKVTHSIWNQVQYSADLCIKCNICTSHCPVTNVTDLFPGPKFVGPQAQRFRNPKDISVD